MTNHDKGLGITRCDLTELSDRVINIWTNVYAGLFWIKRKDNGIRI